MFQGAAVMGFDRHMHDIQIIRYQRLIMSWAARLIRHYADFRCMLALANRPDMEIGDPVSPVNQQRARQPVDHGIVGLPVQQDL